MEKLVQYLNKNVHKYFKRYVDFSPLNKQFSSLKLPIILVDFASLCSSLEERGDFAVIFEEESLIDGTGYNGHNFSMSRKKCPAKH